MYWEDWVSFTQYSECFHLKVCREYFYVKVLGKLSERYCVKGIGRIGYYQWKISFGSSRNAAMQLARERTPLKPYQCFSPIQSINLALSKFQPTQILPQPCPNFDQRFRRMVSKRQIWIRSCCCRGRSLVQVK